MFVRVCFDNEVGGPTKTYERSKVEKVLIRTDRKKFEVHEDHMDIFEVFGFGVLRIHLPDGRVESIFVKKGEMVVTSITDFNSFSGGPFKSSPGDKTIVVCYAEYGCYSLLFPDRITDYCCFVAGIQLQQTTGK